MAQYEDGARIRLVYMPDDPDPVPGGTLGTVESSTDVDWGERKFTQYHVAWDNGRALSVVVPPDIIERVH